MRFGENIDDVINNLENHSNRPTNGAQRLSVFFRGPSMVGAEVACRSNQHGGLFLNDLHVVVNRIRFTAPIVSRICPVTSSSKVSAKCSTVWVSSWLIRREAWASN